MVIRWTNLALIPLAGITFAGPNTRSAISISVAHWILTKSSFGFSRIFNLKAFHTQQLYEIWLYISSIIIYVFVYNPVYSVSSFSYCKVHWNIDVGIYHSFGPQFLSMKVISSSQWVTYVYEARSCLGCRIISFPSDTQQITTIMFISGNLAMLLVAWFLAILPKSVAGCLLHCRPYFLAPQISLAHFFNLILTRCLQIHLALSKLSNSSQFSIGFKTSVTAVSQCRRPSWSCLKCFCRWMMDRCLFSRIPATHTFCHLLNAL